MQLNIDDKGIKDYALRLELPDECPVCGSLPTTYEGRYCQGDGQPRKDAGWRHEVRFGCDSCYMVFSHDPKPMMSRCCNNAHEVAIALKQRLDKSKKKGG